MERKIRSIGSRNRAVAGWIWRQKREKEEEEEKDKTHTIRRLCLFFLPAYHLQEVGVLEKRLRRKIDSFFANTFH